jgi:hypothetical protein
MAPVAYLGFSLARGHRILVAKEPSLYAYPAKACLFIAIDKSYGTIAKKYWTRFPLCWRLESCRASQAHDVRVSEDLSKTKFPTIPREVKHVHRYRQKLFAPQAVGETPAFDVPFASKSSIEAHFSLKSHRSHVGSGQRWLKKWF